MKLFPSALWQAVELACRWHVALFLLIYGLVKYKQFQDPSVASDAVNTLSGMQLMWLFYGFSKPYALFIGIAEMGGAVLLLFRRTVLLGCLLLTAVLVNIIAQDLAYGVSPGALRMAVINQLLIVVIVALNKQRVVAIWSAFTALAPIAPEREPWGWQRRIARGFVAFLVILAFTWWYTH
ncbi:MAG TPA: hypothetical protein VHL57_09530 [Flavobacteriales bacterium]|jgi:hypothetical protein|nr:hypothetical protein [Flavobacteriales bacterium]